MPTLQVKTVSAEQVWSKGDLVISKLVLDYNGQEVQAKTYSKSIAVPGWSGTVETYEKQGRNGSETFVKQPLKEGGYSGGSSSQTGTQASRSYPQQAKPGFDSYTMYLSYVKDIAVALINTKAYTEERLQELATQVAATGEMFYAMRPDGDAKKPETAPDTSGLDKVFGATEEITIQEEDIPWSPTEPPQLTLT